MAPPTTLHPAPGLLVAQVGTGTLVRSLLIAAVLVTPYFLYKRRQVRALRASREAAAAPPAVAPPSAPRLEDVVARVEELAATTKVGGSATLAVPAGVTVDGREAPPELVDALVRDALRRSGLTATGEVDTADGRLIEVGRRT